MPLGRLLAELKRRKVFRVVGAYALAAWVAVEVAATTFPLLGWSDATAKVVLVVALAGFPIVVVLSWIFDLTPDGLRRTAALAEPQGDATRAARNVPSHAKALGMFGVGVLVALVGFAAWPRVGGAPAFDDPAEGIRSVAVLPFVDMSATRDQEYFADGLTEELLNSLAQIEGLRVPARTSSFAFKGVNAEIRDIARQLGVQTVLEGSVRRDGDRLRITAQLIDASTGYHLWSENYDRPAGEVFALQDELARAIVGRLRLQFAPAAPIDVGTDNARAHDLYLQGLSLWHRRTPASLREALELFQAAVAEDSLYARAWAGLAQTYVLLPSLAEFSFEEALSQGSAAAARALELDATLAEAHGALGQIAQNFEWDLQGAERAYRRAVRFDSAYATGHQWHAEALMMLGDLDGAEAGITAALERDPLAPAALAVQGYLRLVTGNTGEAVAVYTDLLRVHPDFTLGRLNLVFALIQAGRRDDAAAQIDRLELPAQLAAAARTVTLGGADRAEALGRLDAALPASVSSLWHMAADDRVGALRVLEEALVEQQDGNLPFVLLHPLLAPLRGDARFGLVAEEVGVAIPG